MISVYPVLLTLPVLSLLLLTVKAVNVQALRDPLDDLGKLLQFDENETRITSENATASAGPMTQAIRQTDSQFIVMSRSG